MESFCKLITFAVMDKYAKVAVVKILAVFWLVHHVAFGSVV